ncbi:hypothetical protein GBF38_010715 [Nibea albiflora]|uniref:Uncharacterized protein n=1 Tax=Nibea albiflora TaxID=240163 RepID=A0ACB7ESR1_NIBAL|nr:hypothetical protein GBF38_010715 [Nibea albiflora]
MNTTHGKLNMEHTDFKIPVEVIQPRIKSFLDRLSGHQWIRLVTGFTDDRTVELSTEMCEDVMDVCLKNNLTKRNTPPQTESEPGQSVTSNQSLGYSVFSAMADAVGVSDCSDSDLISDLNAVMNEELAERIRCRLSRSRSSDEVSEPAASPDRLSRMVSHVLDILKTLAVRSCNEPTKEILDVKLADETQIRGAVSKATTVDSTTEETLHKWDKKSCGLLVTGFVCCSMKNAPFKLSRDECRTIINSIQEVLQTEISDSDIPVKPYAKDMKGIIKAAHSDLCKLAGGAGTLRLSLLTKDRYVNEAIAKTLKRHLVGPQKDNCVKGFFKVLGKNVVKLFTTCF